MDAVVMNGANKRQKGINGFGFSEAPSGFNFASPPDFSNGIWSIPNKMPDNGWDGPLVGYMGCGPSLNATNMDAPANVKMLQMANEDVFSLVEWNGEKMAVKPNAYMYCLTEAFIIKDFFAFPEMPPFPLLPPDNLTRQEYQYQLDLIQEASQAALYEAFYLVEGKMDSQTGGVVSTEYDWSSWIANLFGDDGEFNFGSLWTPWNLPFEFFGPGDYTRFWRFFNGCYNTLSAAYGTNQRINMFPEVDRWGNFWDKVWSGIKRFFPLMVIGRTAFLQCVRFNLLHLADRMDDFRNQSSAKDKDLKETWKGLGGSYSALTSAISDGLDNGINGGGIGEPTTFAAILATATPIIIAITSLIGKLIPGTEDEVDTFSNLFGAVNALNNAECQQYIASITEFANEFAFDGMDLDSISDQFNTAFPDVPQTCIDAAITLIGDKFNFEPENESGSSGGGSGSIDFGEIFEDIFGENETDEGGNSLFPLITIGTVLYLATK